MKIRLWFLLGCLCFWVAPLAVHAQPESEYIEQLPTGCINWTRGVVRATGMDPMVDLESQTRQILDVENAFREASYNLLDTLRQVRLTNCNNVAGLLDTQKAFQANIEEMAAAAKLVKTTKIPDGRLAVTLEMSLFGGFAQLVLPSEIRQVESIRPLNGNGITHQESDPPPTVVSANGVSGVTAYTGLLIDARGVDAVPSMVPVITDEDGQEVYGPAFVSREYAVQNGVCRYIKGGENPPDLPLIAPNPLIVKGLRTVAKGSCDIVISNADASRIRGASSHLVFLKQCRVIIILD